MNLGLTDTQIKQISLVLETAGASRVAVFGSRAKGNWRPNSDIDIAVWGKNVNIGRVLSDLDELPMPYKFDVLDYDDLTNIELRDHIDRVGQVIFTRASPSTPEVPPSPQTA